MINDFRTFFAVFADFFADGVFYRWCSKDGNIDKMKVFSDLIYASLACLALFFLVLFLPF